MQAFLKAWLKTGREEGGYVNNPKDSGGPTNFGITERVARAHGFKGDMKDLPQDVAREIAKSQYWDVMRLDEVAALSQSIAEELFDTGFNASPEVAARWLQRCLNVGNRGATDYPDMKVDGMLGRITVYNLSLFLKRRGVAGERAMLNALNGLQSAFFTSLAEAREKDEEFWFGWQLNRVRFSS